MSKDERRARQLAELMLGINRGIESTDGTTYEEFCDSWRVQAQLASQLILVGQHVHRLNIPVDGELRRVFRTLRDDLAHDYFVVRPERLWAAHARLPGLKEDIEQRLAAEQEKAHENSPRQRTEQRKRDGASNPGLAGN